MPTGVMKQPWRLANTGDYTGYSLTTFLVIARHLDRKWRAQNLAAHIPNAQVIMDTPSTWAVLLPIEVA